MITHYYWAGEAEMHEQEISPDTPVLIGFAAIEQRERDHRDARDAAQLMIDAARAALPGELSGRILPHVDWIGTTDGLSHYPNSARIVAEAIGAPGARTVLAKVGVMQQTLISKACSLVQSGASQLALVVGGEARYRDVRASAVGETADLMPQSADDRPDEVLSPAAELVLECERAVGLAGAPPFYALLESEWRFRHGKTLDEQREHLGQLCARFTEIAAGNPHATRRDPRSPEYLRDPSAENPMVAFPYTKLMITTWTVDQSSALFFCTAATAERYGVPRDRWLFPLVAVESNHLVPTTARKNLTQPGAMAAMSRAAHAATGIATSQIDLLDLYSCFPIAVKMEAEGLGLPPGRDVTVTGGMQFAGGPYNSYVFQALCRAAELLAAGKGKTALVSCVSGIYTKQGFTILSTEPPRRPFSVVDVTAEVDEIEGVLPVDDLPTGSGTIAACTVVFSDNRPQRAIAVIDLPNERRTIAACDDPVVMDTVMSVEVIGSSVWVDNGSFALDSAAGASTDQPRLATDTPR